MRVVLLHAFPLDERMWEPQRGGLHGHELLTPRLYGRGRTMDDWAASLLEEIPGELVLVGASIGGYCALAMKRRAPERVAGLVLVGSRADADSPERRAGRADTIELIRREGSPGLWDSMRPKLFTESADPGLLERARAIALDQDADQLVAAVEAIRDRRDNSELLGGRTLAILGDADPFVSEAEVPAAEVHVLPGAGHLVNMQRATETNELLEGWLERWT
ncbi:MAG: alpha/beta hydrolase [Actinomycetota bacterium]|nr:alpha/beta hydrolase [Actinomycetota bacterium]